VQHHDVRVDESILEKNIYYNQNYWENSKWYYVNVERGNAADKLNGRTINVSFTNNSNVPIEVMIFKFCSDEIAIDVKTGLVTRHKD
jgi:hypothetical protein